MLFPCPRSTCNRVLLFILSVLWLEHDGRVLRLIFKFLIFTLFQSKNVKFRARDFLHQSIHILHVEQSLGEVFPLNLDFLIVSLLHNSQAEHEIIVLAFYFCVCLDYAKLHWAHEMNPICLRVEFSDVGYDMPCVLLVEPDSQFVLFIRQVCPN